MEELGDAGWAKERERMAHLQQIQQLHQLQLQQLQQQQVAYPGYAGVPPVQLQGPVMVPSPGDPLSAPRCPVPIHGGMMVPVGGPVPPPGHIPAPWPVHWDQTQPSQGNVPQQSNWEHNNHHKAAIVEKRHQAQDVYFHPGSENGHLDVRISEWKGKHCFYQGPEDYSHQDYSRVAQEKGSNNFSSQEDEDRRRRDNRVREDDCYDYERYDHRNQRDMEYDSRDKPRYREHYDRKYSERYESRERQYYDSRTPHKADIKDRYSYSSECEDYYHYKDAYDRRDNYRDAAHCYDHDRDYYDSRESPYHKLKENYKRQEEDDHYYDERKHRDHRYDREERYKGRESSYKDRDVYYQSSDETHSSKQRAHYDSEPGKYNSHKEKDHYDRRIDTKEDWRDEEYVRRKEHNWAREHSDRRTADLARDHGDRKTDDHLDHEYDARDREYARYKSRQQYQDLRSLSADSSYEEYPKKDRRTHCEEWVEQQNKKLREMHSFEDPVTYRHNEEKERGYESSASTSSKRGHKPIYVGSLDRNSFYRKTAPSSLSKSKYATTRKQNKGKQMSCKGM